MTKVRISHKKGCSLSSEAVGEFVVRQKMGNWTYELGSLGTAKPTTPDCCTSLPSAKPIYKYGLSKVCTIQSVLLSVRQNTVG